MKLFIENSEWENVSSIEINSVPKGFNPFDTNFIKEVSEEEEKDYFITFYYVSNKGEDLYMQMLCEDLKINNDRIDITGVLQGAGDLVENERDIIKV